MSQPGRRFRLLCVLAGFCLAYGPPSEPVTRGEPFEKTAKFEVRFVKDDADRWMALEFLNGPAVRFADLAGKPDADETLARMFAVHVVDKSAKANQPAMLGSFTIHGNVVRFIPRYPFRPGTEYQIVVRGADAGGNPLEKGAGDRRAVRVVVKVPEEREHEPCEVERIFPSTAVLPENHLRFYIHFSEPMGRGEAYEHLRLLDEEGRPMPRAFLELGEELWDASGRRLTLLIDPGRIKRGLQPREELGPVLEAGRAYTLVVDPRWPDATGRPLAREFRKPFQVAEPVTAAIDPNGWKVEPPCGGSKGALVVRLPRPLDRALLERSLAVVDKAGAGIPGEVRIGSEERRWEYFPERAWESGSYEIVVDPVLEDTSGNQIGRPFEVDERQPGANKTAPVKVRIPFAIGKNPCAL